MKEARDNKHNMIHFSEVQRIFFVKIMKIIIPYLYTNYTIEIHRMDLYESNGTKIIVIKLLVILFCII